MIFELTRMGPIPSLNKKQQPATIVDRADAGAL